MKMLVIVQVEFDADKQGVDSLSDAQFIANLAARTELAKDDGEDSNVIYAVMEA